MMREEGVMVIKGDKAWSSAIRRGSPVDQFVNIELGSVYDPESVKKPYDVTYKNSPYIKELRGAKVVPVVRTTKVERL